MHSIDLIEEDMAALLFLLGVASGKLMEEGAMSSEMKDAVDRILIQTGAYPAFNERLKVYPAPKKRPVRG